MGGDRLRKGGIFLKKKIFSLLFAVILILLILFAVLYTRPRTLLSLTGNPNPTPDFASTSSTTFFKDRDPQTDRWQLSREQLEDPAVRSEFMELAGSIQYRRSLRSLFRPNYLERDFQRIGTETSVNFKLPDGTYIRFDHLGTAVGIYRFGDEGYVLATVVNEEALAALSDYIIEIGEKD